MNQHIPCAAKNGFNRVLDIGDRGMAMTGFGLAKLSSGETWSADSSGNEVVLVVLGGKCTVTAGNTDFGEIAPTFTIESE